MRWTNKRHQFDKFIKDWSVEYNYYIWGASNTGIRFYSKFKNILKINGFIDNDINKQGTNIDEYNIYSFDEIKSKKFDSRIIVASEAYFEISEQLIKAGYVENRDFCNSKTFVSTYFMYKQNEIYLFRTDISITNKCTLRCEKCNMSMPYFKIPQNRDIEIIKDDIDLYFKWVDNVETVKILGGEPFIYPQLVDVIKYLGENYKGKIENIDIFTNGTLRISDETLKVLKKYNISVQVSDYSNSLINLKEKVDSFIKKLEEYDITYLRLVSDKWLDFGDFSAENFKLNDDEVINMFDKCSPTFRGLHDKRLYYCHLSASAVQAHIFTDNKNDYFNLEEYDENRKIELMEFDLGYNDLGYVTFCKKCNGCSSVNNSYVEVAKQMTR